MRRYLWVGDPHAEPHDLDDARALTKMVGKLASSLGATVVLAGDLYDTHAIIHAEVQYFWWEFLRDLKAAGVPVIIIKGNHDQPGVEGSMATALIAHIEQAACVLYGPRLFGKLLFCPYASGEKLVEWSKQFPECTTLFCHQTFDGSTYDNGFYAGDGVDPNLIAQKRIVSGHIHTPQEFGKVWYPGAPRWRNMNDANVDRALWLLSFDDDDKLVNKVGYDTGQVCRRIYLFEETPTKLLPKHLPFDGKNEVHVLLKGPQAFIDERKPLLDALGVRLRTVRTDARASARVKESEGVGVAFSKYLDAYEPRHGTPKPVLKSMAEERVVSGL
jgi:DNA repair exonuclease SbcCD nuclease subunit